MQKVLISAKLVFGHYDFYFRIYCPSIAVYDLYNGTYRAGYTYFVYIGAFFHGQLVSTSAGCSIISWKLCNL